MLRSMLRCHGCHWIVLLLFASAARAEPVPFEQGHLTLQFGPLYGLAVPAGPGASGIAEVQATAGGAITRVALPAGVFVANAVSIPFEDQTELAYMPPIGGVQLTFANEAGTFSRTVGTSTGPLHGTMPLAGIHRFCVFFVACGAMPSANVSVPLSVIGQGGVTKVTFVPSVTLGGDPWSTGTVSFDGPDAETATTAGTVQPGSESTLVRLVTPVFLSTNTTGTYPTTRGVGVLTFVLKPVPEPAATALLPGAIAALAGVGWRRRRAN